MTWAPTRRKYREGNLCDVKYHLWVVRSNLINGQPPKQHAGE